MIQELFIMNGYGVYVWSAFSFTLASFSILYLIVKTQYVKEKKRFNAKFNSLSYDRQKIAKHGEYLILKFKCVRSEGNYLLLSSFPGIDY